MALNSFSPSVLKIGVHWCFYCNIKITDRLFLFLWKKLPLLGRLWRRRLGEAATLALGASAWHIREHIVFGGTDAFSMKTRSVQAYSECSKLMSLCLQSLGVDLERSCLSKGGHILEAPLLNRLVGGK